MRQARYDLGGVTEEVMDGLGCFHGQSPQAGERFLDDEVEQAVNEALQYPVFPVDDRSFSEEWAPNTRGLDNCLPQPRSEHHKYERWVVSKFENWRISTSRAEAPASRGRCSGLVDRAFAFRWHRPIRPWRIWLFASPDQAVGGP
jgi:hypothetical protein